VPCSTRSSGADGHELVGGAQEHVAVGVGEQEGDLAGRVVLGEDLQVVARRVVGGGDRVRLDPLDHLILGEVVAGAEVRRRDVDEVEDRIEREHQQEQGAGQQVLERDRPARPCQVDEVDDHQCDDRRDRDRVVGLGEGGGECGDHDRIDEAEQDDLDDRAARRAVAGAAGLERRRRWRRWWIGRGIAAPIVEGVTAPGGDGVAGAVRLPPGCGVGHQPAIASRIVVAALVNASVGSVPVKIRL
jgi:hypothetical protein